MPLPPTLYHVPRTISSPLVQLLIELDLVANNTNNADKEGAVHIHEMTFPELKTPEYLALHPMGTSPAYKDDTHDFVLWESGAILDLLLEQHDTTFRFHPCPSTSTLHECATYYNRKQFILVTFFPFVTKLFLQYRSETTTPSASTQALLHQYHTVFAPMLLQWLDTNDYFWGNRISAIDFLITKSLGNLHSMGLLQDPVVEVYQRVTRRPSYAPAYEGLDTWLLSKSTLTTEESMISEASTVSTASATAASTSSAGSVDMTTNEEPERTPQEPSGVHFIRV